MVKTIRIDGKDYDMKSSAYTQFAYKNLTGRSFLSDIESLSGIKGEDFSKVDGLIEILLDISYVMIDEANPNRFKNEQEFIKSIDHLFEEPKWIEEVVALAIMPLSAGNNKTN